jgi:hypothetical protein
LPWAWLAGLAIKVRTASKGTPVQLRGDYYMWGDAVDMLRPLIAEILTEWTMADPATDFGQWHEALDRYESGIVAGQSGVDEAAELMCAGLAHLSPVSR